jgi:hypothetical protein
MTLFFFNKNKRDKSTNPAKSQQIRWSANKTRWTNLRLAFGHQDKRDTCRALYPASKDNYPTRAFWVVGFFVASENLVGMPMDIQARIGSITSSRSFCSRKHKSSSSSSHSFSNLYFPLRLLCSRRNFQEPPENDNNSNKGMPSFAAELILFFFFFFFFLI